MSPANPYLIPGPVLSFGPGLGVHPSRQGFTPSTRRLQMPAYTSLAEMLVQQARAMPEVEAVYLLDLEDRLNTLTWAGLLGSAQLAASALARRGLGRGDRVFLCFDTSPELLAAFFGCALLGAVPLLAEPPTGFARVLSWQERVKKMVADAEAKALVVEERLRDGAGQVAAQAGGLTVLGPSELLEPGPAPEVPSLGLEDLAFIQFSSGTTSDAKGVMVTNLSLMTNARCMGEASQWRENELGVCWLPLHHDMGLVSGVLTMLLHGRSIALMPPISFVFKPQRWLWAIHYFRGCISQAPNFAYQLCNSKIPEDQLRGLDLSSWRLAFNGAEFINHTTVKRFRERFIPYGLKSTTQYPVYGMAEMALAATFPEPGTEPVMDIISRERLSEHGEAIPVPAEDPSALTLVAVGHPFPGHALKIVDADGLELPERRQGQILLKGPSLTAGYINQPEKTAQTFRDGWLWTGDLGYVVDGKLFISGRIKDLIIRGGRNYHPYAFEEAASHVPGCRQGAVAAFGAPDEATGTESVFLVCETSLEEPGAVAELCRRVEKAVYDATGLRPDKVLPAPPRTLPKTSSGKMQRGRVRDMVLSGKLPPVKPAE